MDNISNLIEALTQFLNNQNELAQNNPLITAETIAIFAALLSFGGLLYTVWKNSKLQNANARVEWIQNVRNVTAEIISSYASALNEDDPHEVQKIVVEVREKIERLILFFGHETKPGKVIDVLDTKSRILSQAEARLDNLSSELQDNIIGISKQEEIEVDGEHFVNTEYEFDERIENNHKDALIKVNEIKKFNEELASSLVKLRNIIRIYLKIEWNKAKKGK